MSKPQQPMSKESVVEWQKAKTSTLEQIGALPEYDDDMILSEYTALLAALPEVAHLPAKHRAFLMQDKFPQFAIAYSGLFNMACRRPDPISVEAVKSMLETAAKQKAGEIKEEKSRGIIMDIAESIRRQRETERKA